MLFTRMTSFSLLLVTMVACGSGQQSPTVNIAAEQAAIMALEKEWSDMFVAGDLDGISAILAKDTVLLAPGEAPIVGANNVRAATQAMLASGDVEVSWISNAAFVAPGGDMAYDYGTATTKLTDGSVVEGQYLVVWIREDGKWKVAADMFN
jgi:ketosteroid isomerase-like protein